jgi:hypothetical protein
LHLSLPIREFLSKMSNNPNPNVTNAKRRGGARPKSQNTPSESVSKSFKWVEPLPQPVQVDVGFEFNQTVEVPLRFEIDYLLPSTIASPYQEILSGTVYRDDGSQQLLATLLPALEALTYFKCAQKLYATMTPDAQSRVQTLKGVFYDTMPIPTTMSRLIDSIGNFKTSFGEARLSHQVTTFLRFVAKGLSVGEDLSEIAEIGEDDGEPEQFLWKNSESLEIIKDQVAAELEEIMATNHELTVFDGDGQEFILCARLPEWDNNYSAAEAFPEDARDRWRTLSICKLLNQNHFDNAALPAGTPPTWDLQRLLSEIHLAVAPAAYSLPLMKEAFIMFQTRYNQRCRMHIDAYFTTCEPVKGSSGYASQLVTATETTLDTMFPLSDADAVTGFILSPLKSIDFKSNYMSYSRRPRKAAASDVAFQATKNVAH